MSNIEIRPLNLEERIPVSRLLGGYAFDPTPPLPQLADWERLMFHLREATYLALFEAGQPVAVAASSPMRQNVRGHIYMAGGVWGVATHPSARRKGYARRVLLQLFASERDSGCALSCLYPFRESFYSRLGYVNFSQARTVRFSPMPLLPLLEWDFEGRVELLPYAEGLDEYRAFLHEELTRTHGMGLFSDTVAELGRERGQSWLALARSGGAVVGAMTYKLEDDGGTFKMVVSHFYYSTIEGRYLLLEWFARHANQAHVVEIKTPPVERPETWFPDLNVQTIGIEPPMGRVQNVAGLAGMQTGEGRFSAYITDPICPWNEGDYLFESIDGHLQVSRAQSADCTLTISGLTALVYGTHEPESFAIRSWGDPTPDTQTILKAMFPPMFPYLDEVF